MTQKLYRNPIHLILSIIVLCYTAHCAGDNTITTLTSNAANPTYIADQTFDQQQSQPGNEVVAVPLVPDLTLTPGQISSGVKSGVKTLGGQATGKVGGNVVGNVAGTAAGFGVQDILTGQQPTTAQSDIALRQGLVATSDILETLPGVKPLAPFAGQYVSNQYQTGGSTSSLMSNLQAPLFTPLKAGGKQLLVELAPTIQSAGTTAAEQLPTAVQGPIASLLGKLPSAVTTGETAAALESAGQLGAQAGQATAAGITSALQSGAGLVGSAAQGTALGTGAGEFATQAGITGAKAATTAAELGASAGRIGLAAIEAVEPVTAGLAASNAIGVADLATGGTLHQGIDTATQNIASGVNTAASGLGSALGGQQSTGVNQISQGATSLGTNLVNIAENVGFGGSNTPTTVAGILGTELGANANIVKGVANLVPIPGIGGAVNAAVNTVVSGITQAAQATGQAAYNAAQTASSSGPASGAILGTMVMPGVGTALGAGLGAIPGVGNAFSTVTNFGVNTIGGLLGLSSAQPATALVQNVSANPQGTAIYANGKPQVVQGGVVVQWSPGGVNAPAPQPIYFAPNTGIHTLTTYDGKTINIDTTNPALAVAGQSSAAVQAAQQQAAQAQNTLGAVAQNIIAGKPAAPPGVLVPTATLNAVVNNPNIANAPISSTAGAGLVIGADGQYYANTSAAQKADILNELAALGQAQAATTLLGQAQKQQQAVTATLSQSAPGTGPTINALQNVGSGQAVTISPANQGLSTLKTTVAATPTAPITSTPLVAPVSTTALTLLSPTAKPVSTGPITATTHMPLQTLTPAAALTAIGTAKPKVPVSTAALTTLIPMTAPTAQPMDTSGLGSLLTHMISTPQSSPSVSTISNIVSALNPTASPAQNTATAQLIQTMNKAGLAGIVQAQNLGLVPVPSPQQIAAQTMTDIMNNTPGGASAVMQLKGPTALTQNQAAAILANPQIASPSAVSLAQSQFPTMTQQSANNILNPPTPTLQPITQAQLTALSTPPAFPTSQYDLLKQQPTAPLPVTSVMPVTPAPTPMPTTIYTQPATPTATVIAQPTPMLPVYTTPTGTPVYSNPVQSPTGNVTMGGSNANPAPAATVTSSYTSGPMISAPVSTPWVPAANPEAGLQSAGTMTSQLAHTTAVAGPPTYSH